MILSERPQGFVQAVRILGQEESVACDLTLYLLLLKERRTLSAAICQSAGYEAIDIFPFSIQENKARD